MQKKELKVTLDKVHYWGCCWKTTTSALTRKIRVRVLCAGCKKT